MAASHQPVWLLAVFILASKMHCNSLFEDTSTEIAPSNADALDPAAGFLSLFDSGDHPLDDALPPEQLPQQPGRDDSLDWLPQLRGRGRPRRLDVVDQPKKTTKKQRPAQTNPTFLQKTLNRIRTRRWDEIDGNEKPPADSAPAGDFKEIKGDPERGADLASAKVAALLFTGDTLRQASAHVGERLGMSGYLVGRTVRRVAALALRCQDNLSTRLIRWLLKSCSEQPQSDHVMGFAADSDSGAAESSAAGGHGDRGHSARPARPHLFMRICQYDETPIVLRLQPREEASNAALKKNSHHLPIIVDDEPGDTLPVDPAATENPQPLPTAEGPKLGGSHKALKQTAKLFLTVSDAGTAAMHQIKLRFRH